MSELPLPEITPLNEPYWSALREGRLVFQACACGHKWLPARHQCPNCLQDNAWQWAPASGLGKVVSWVVYHVAYHPAFADRIPYNVAIVELDEGPRLISNITTPNASIVGDLRVRLAPAVENNFTIARFAPAETDAGG